MKYKVFNTIAFRLTLWFTGIFTICASFVFLLFYYLATQTLQNQIDQELTDHASKFNAIIRTSGLMGARQLAVLEAQAAGEKLIFFRIVYPTGEVFASSRMSYWKNVHVSQSALQKLSTQKTNVFETIEIPATHQKARILYSYVAANAILQTGVAMDVYSKFLSAFKLTFISAMGFIVFFSAVSGWLLVREALSRVETITKTAQNISGSNLEARVQGTGNKDELDHLVLTFNSMLDRIEELVRSIREMTDNIAHDLKSPVTRIRGFAELALVHEENFEDYRNMAANTIEESDRLLDMFNIMLMISKAEAGEEDFIFKPINLTDMIREACDLFAPLADDKNILFTNEIEDKIFIDADIRMFQRAFSNLLDNAIKYTSKGGRISISAFLENQTVVIRVADTGIGVPPGFHEKIFERFFRIDSSRTNSGTGLGLSFARTIIRRHRGDIHVTSDQNMGSVFEIRLPINNPKII
ncbi:MAG: ATP-binding protein [Desulfobacula sp.]|jgi:heavy metal sensor kinase